MLQAPFFTEWPHDLGDDRAFFAAPARMDAHTHEHVTPPPDLAHCAHALSAQAGRLICWWRVAMTSRGVCP